METQVEEIICVDVMAPILRFPEFEEKRQEKKLEEIAEINPRNKILPSSFIYIDLESVNKGLLTKEERLPLESAPSRAQRLLKKGDVLFQMVRPYQKNNFYFDKNGDYVASTGYAQLRTQADSRFLYQYLHVDTFVNKVLLRCTGTSYPAINSSDLGKIRITFPSLPEQQKISTFLTAVDDKTQQLFKKKELLEKYKKAVIQQIFSQQIRFKDENGRDYPEWEGKNGNIIFANISDKNHNSDLPILAITQEFGAIPRDLIDYNISVTDKSIESYKVVQEGDFIISLRSFQGGIEYSNYKGLCSPAYIILRPRQNINRYFFKFYFKTESYIGLLNKKLEGIRDGKMISYKYFSDIKLPLPSLPEQNKIADFLSAIDLKITQVAKQLEQAQQFKKGLLQQMFV